MQEGYKGGFQVAPHFAPAKERSPLIISVGDCRKTSVTHESRQRRKKKKKNVENDYTVPQRGGCASPEFVDWGKMNRSLGCSNLARIEPPRASSVESRRVTRDETVGVAGGFHFYSPLENFCKISNARAMTIFFSSFLCVNPAVRISTSDGWCDPRRPSPGLRKSRIAERGPAMCDIRTVVKPARHRWAFFRFLLFSAGWISSFCLSAEMSSRMPMLRWLQTRRSGRRSR